jgi:hypothetical protein
MCRNCGVEIEEEYSYCPLCGLSLKETDGLQPYGESLQIDTEEEGTGTYAEYHSVIERHEERLRILLQYIWSFTAVTALIVVFAVDFSFDMEISWARFPLLSIAYLWLFTFEISKLKRRAYLLLTALLLTTAVFLMGMDSFTPGPTWFLPLALPLLGILAVATAVVVALIRLFGLSILGGLSAALAAAGLAIVGTEAILDLFLEKPLRITWSLIPAAAVLPIIAFLFSFEKRLKRRGSDLDKFFHV